MVDLMESQSDGLTEPRSRYCISLAGAPIIHLGYCRKEASYRVSLYSKPIPCWNEHAQSKYHLLVTFQCCRPLYSYQDFSKYSQAPTIALLPPRKVSYETELLILRVVSESIPEVKPRR